MIDNVSFNRYRNGEFVSFIDNVLELTNKFDLDALGLLPRWENLYKVYEELLKVYKISRGQSLTKQLVVLDRLRDQYYMGLLLLSENHVRYHPNANLREELQPFVDMLLTHGRDITTKAYQEETAVLEDIIEKVQSGSFTALLARLDLETYFKALVESNENFNSVYLDRNTKYSEIKKGEVERLRKETEEAYRALIRMISAFAEINGLTDYEPMIDQINSLIEKYGNEIKRRISNPEESTDTDTDFEDVVEEGE